MSFMGKPFSTNPMDPSELILYRAVSTTREILEADPSVSLQAAAFAACAPYTMPQKWVDFVAKHAGDAFIGCKRGRRA